MPHDVGALRKLLQEFQAGSGAEGSAVVSRSGVPIAWILPEAAHVDNFGTMTATLIGALDVINSGLHKPSVDRVVVQSDGGYLVAHNLTPGAFFVAVAGTLTPKLEKAASEVAKRAKGFLGAEEV